MLVSLENLTIKVSQLTRNPFLLLYQHNTSMFEKKKTMAILCEDFVPIYIKNSLVCVNKAKE